MKKRGIQRLIAMLLTIIMLVGNSSLTALAGPDISSGSNGITHRPGNGNTNGKSLPGSVHINGGGWKISVLRMDKGTYDPSDIGNLDLPIYNTTGDKGATPISLNGTDVPSYYKGGLYGIGSIYFTDSDWSTNAEYSATTDLDFGRQPNALKGKKITKNNIENAVKNAGVTDATVANDIWSAFGTDKQTRIFGVIREFNDFLKMSADENRTEEKTKRNEDVLNTILQLVIDKYGSNSAIGKEIKALKENSSEEYCINIEAMGHINIDGIGNAYVTPAAWAMAAFNIKPNQYVTYGTFTEMMSNIKSENTEFTSYMSTHFTGLKRNGIWTSHIGSGLGGTNPDTSNPMASREGIFYKSVFIGPVSIGSDGEAVRAKITDYKAGFGILASSDFLEQVPDHSVKSASSSITILGQKSGLTPNISVSLATEGETRDANLDSKVSTAIQVLDSFANNNILTIENIEQHLNSSTCADILKILITEYNTSSLVATSMSNKQEDVTGKITDILGSAGLQLDSLYIARYMNMLIKNGGTNENGDFTFNTEVNKALIGYLYTIFDPDILDGYGVLNNIELAYRSTESKNNIKNLGIFGNVVDTSSIGTGEITKVKIFNGLEASVITNRTSRDLVYVPQSIRNDLGIGNGVFEDEAEKVGKLNDLKDKLIPLAKEALVIKRDIDMMDEVIRLYTVEAFTVEAEIEQDEQVDPDEQDGKLGVYLFKTYNVVDMTYEEYTRYVVEKFYPYIENPLSKKGLEDLQARLKSELNRDFSIQNFSDNPDSLMEIAKELNKLYHELQSSEVVIDVDGYISDPAGIMHYLGEVVRMMKERLDKYNDLLIELEAEGITMDEEIELYIKDNRLQSDNWVDRLNAITNILGASLEVLATELNESIEIRVIGGLASGLNEMDKESEYIVSGIINNQNTQSYGSEALRTSVDMTNALSSLSSSTHLSDFSNIALKLPNTDIGASTASSGLNTGQKIYYSPIVSVESNILNGGYYGGISYGHSGYEIDTAGFDLDAYKVDGVYQLSTEMLDDLRKSSLTIPNNSLYAMSDEIQVLLSDYVNDCIAYTEWYWSDVNNSSTKSRADLNKKLDNELQYRVGMYLDIIKDTRPGAKYYNMLTNKELAKAVLNNITDTVQPDYRWTWVDKANNKGKLVRSPYYIDVTNENGETLLDEVSARVDNLTGINKGLLIENLNKPLVDGIYHKNLFGGILPYLSERTYKFNQIDTNLVKPDVDVYVGGAFQYPLSYVTCDIDFEHFGKDLKLKDTFTYSVFSYNTNNSENTDYFVREWPVDSDGINLGVKNGVYDVSRMLVALINGAMDGGLTIYDRNDKRFYSVVDANALNTSTTEGSILSLASVIRTVLGIEDSRFSSLDDLVDLFQTDTGNDVVGADLFISERLIALTQYILDNINVKAINDSDTRNYIRNTVKPYLEGNGGFENTINNILSASTDNIKYSWVNGIDDKLKSDSQIRDTYKSIMASVLGDIGATAKTIIPEYVNEVPLVEYTSKGLSYGDITGNEAGGLTINGEVFKYYVENMIAMSNVTKNLTAVYIADDGEVSDTAFITALGGVAMKIDYLNNEKSRLQSEYDAAKATIEEINEDAAIKEITGLLEEFLNDLKEKRDGLLKTVGKPKSEDSKPKSNSSTSNSEDIQKYIELSKEFDDKYAKYTKARDDYRYYKEKYEFYRAYDWINAEKSLGYAKDAVNKDWATFSKEFNTENESADADIKFTDVYEFIKTIKIMNLTESNNNNNNKTSTISRQKEHFSKSIDSYNKYIELSKPYTLASNNYLDYRTESEMFTYSALNTKEKELNDLIDEVNKLSKQRLLLENKKDTATTIAETENKAEKDKKNSIETNKEITELNSDISKYTSEIGYIIQYAEGLGSMGETEIEELQNSIKNIVGEHSDKLDKLIEKSSGKLDKRKQAESSLVAVDKLLKNTSVQNNTMLGGNSLFEDTVDGYMGLLKKNDLSDKINVYAPDGDYIFNLTYWEYEDADSGAVFYLPGNSNAILNPSKINSYTETIGDNHDDRTSKISSMKAFGTNETEIAKSMDAIASLALQSSANKSKNLQVFNFIYSNGSWPMQAIINNPNSNIVASSNIMDQDIPIDAQIIEIDNNGNVLKYHDLIKDFASAPSHVVSSIDIVESFKLGGVEVEVEHIALVPTVDKSGVYEMPDGIGKNIIEALQSTNVSNVNILEGLGVTGVTSYLQSLKDLEYEYDTMGGAETIKGKYLASLTKYDREMYANDSDAHPIMVLLVKVKEPVRQINVIENYDGDTEIDVVEPNTNTDETEVYLSKTIKVKDVTGNGIGKIQEWAVFNNEDIPANILIWSDIPSGDAVVNGTGTLVTPIEGGQTVFARYVEDGLAALTGELTLEQNEITRKYAVSTYDGGNLGMLSTISGIDEPHSHDFGHQESGSIEDPVTGVIRDYSYWISNWVPFNYTSGVDSNYEHRYGVTNELAIDGKVVAKVTDPLFKPILKNFTTNKQSVDRFGNSNIVVTPDYDFVLWRGYDVPTLASFKNSQDIKDDLAKLGINSGLVPSNRIIDEGLQDNKYNVNIQIGQDGGDTTTIWACPYDIGESANQIHSIPSNRDHQADAIVRTYTGNKANVAKDQSKDKGSLTFNLDGKSFNTAMGFAIPNSTNISFYPYVKMTYEDISGTETDAYVLSTNLSELNVSDYVDIGYSKSAAVTVGIESNQWSNHKRSTDFIRDNNINDRHSVLPGGATYTLDTKDETAYVGLRTWQILLPSDTIGIVQSGSSYYDTTEVANRRTDLINQVKDGIESYDVVQYIAKGIIKEPVNIVKNGVLLNNIARGQSQTVYGNNLSSDEKYYLRTQSLPASMKANEADLDVINSNQVNQYTYTIKSDVNGRVWVEKNGTSIASISKTEGLNILLANDGVRELDEKTKLITNYLAVIDRNKGDVGGERWYNEAWDGLSVVMTEFEFEVGFKEPGVRTSALDPKLVGKLDNKADVYNFKDESKVRSSVFRTAINNNINGKPRWVATWGETNVDIILRDIENMLISKPFYIPNSTVMDLN